MTTASGDSETETSSEMPPKKKEATPPPVEEKNEFSDEETTNSAARKRKRRNDSEAGPSSSKKAEKKKKVESVVEAAAEKQMVPATEEKKKNRQAKTSSAAEQESDPAEKKRDKQQKKVNGQKTADVNEENTVGDKKKKKRSSEKIAAVVTVEEGDDAKGKSVAAASKPGPKKPAHNWLPKDETVLAKQMLEDLKANPGLNFDEKVKGDKYWNELHEAVKGKLSHEFGPDQIFDKHKRMKSKFKRIEEQGSMTKSGKSRTAVALHEIFKQLWSGEDVATKPGVSAFGSKFTAAVHSDGEESNGEFGGFPLLSPVKKEVMGNGKSILGPVTELNGTNLGAEVSRVMKSFLLETISQVSSVAGADPVISFGSSLCSGVESLMRSYKLGFEASAVNRDVKKRLLEEQAAEYSAMKRRLKLVLEYCEVEEDVLKKKLQAM